jgi:hypothetical protein
MIITLPHIPVNTSEISDPEFTPNDGTELQKHSVYLDKLFADCGFDGVTNTYLHSASNT